MAFEACDTGDGQEVEYIIGLKASGEQLGLCQEHAAHFGLTLALQRLDPAEIINMAQALPARAATNGEEAGDVKPARKRAPKAPPQEPANEPAAEGLAETSAAVDDVGTAGLQPGDEQP